MSLKSLECKLAQGQLSRYLSGEGMSAEMIRQLEGHFGECDDCRELILSRRRTLEDVIVAARAVVEVEVPEAEEPEEAVVPSTPKRNLFRKPVILSSALAVILVAMSYVAKDPTALFGRRLIETVPASSGSETKAAPVVVTTAPTPNPGLAYKPEPQAAAQAIKATEPKPITAPKVEISTKAPKPRLKRKAAPRPASNGIRLYGADGQPISGGN